MIKDIKLKPVVLEKFMEFLTSKCTDEERAEIEKLLSGSKPSEFGEAKTILDPETFTTITKEEYKKKYGDKTKDKYESFIHVSFYFNDKYREYTDELKFNARDIACKDTSSSGHYRDRPFEKCVVFRGISKDQIDKLSEKARLFLSTFSVLDVSEHYDCYNLVLFYNTKDEEGQYYIGDIWMSLASEPLYSRLPIMNDKIQRKMIRPDTLTPCTVEEWENWKKEEIAKYGKEQYERYIRSFFPSDFPEEKIKKFL